MSSSEKAAEVTGERTDVGHYDTVDIHNKGGEEVVEEQLVHIQKVSNTLSVLVSGLALFSDGYNAQIIGFVNPILKKLYPSINPTIKTRMSNAYLIGEIFGMLAFGAIIDRLGRRSGIIFATLFLVLGIIIATAAKGNTELKLFWMIIIGRGISGFGAGGEYPVCATSAVEAGNDDDKTRKRRGLLVALSTDFAIDLGFVMAGVICLAVLGGFHQHIKDSVWRVCFGLGLILPITVLFFRIRLLNSTQYRKHAIKKNVPYGIALKLYWKPLLGMSLAWFCYDFVTYPFGIYSSTIISRLNPNPSMAQNIGYATVTNAFYLPGCIVGGLLMDRIGRKQTMTLGFVLWAIFGFVIGGAIDGLTKVFPLFVVMYGIFNSLGEMGPGVATFVCGAESFPTPLRGHFLGFVAAFGKAGAAIGTQVFEPIENSFSNPDKGSQAVFLIGAAFALVGGVVAWFLIPDKERDLESEDAKFKRYLEEHGYDTSFYGESLEKEIKTTNFHI